MFAPGTFDFNEEIISPRFGVEQGLKPDGSRKIRAVDDCTRSGINGATQPAVKLFVEGADMLIEVMKLLHQECGAVPDVLKADIDSAYKRIPMKPEHRWASNIAFR